jgi:hypothetical protein
MRYRWFCAFLSLLLFLAADTNAAPGLTRENADVSR